MVADTNGALERSNIRQVETLNQRGGRTLSIADLMRAGTITPEAAGFCLRHIALGASFLTGAVPGGAGKSTVLADLLGMLPPGEQIVTTPDDRAVASATAEKDRAGKCYLCHEFGPGMWYGYLWGPTVGQFLDLSSRGGRVAGCLHADDAWQTREALISPTLGVTGKAFARLGLLVYMAVDRDRNGSSRVVSGIWCPDDDGGHRLVFDRNPGTDELVPNGELPQGDGEGPPLQACEDFMTELLDSEVSLFEDVRAATVEFYARHGVLA